MAHISSWKDVTSLQISIRRPNQSHRAEFAIREENGKVKYERLGLRALLSIAAWALRLAEELERELGRSQRLRRVPS